MPRNSNSNGAPEAAAEEGAWTLGPSISPHDLGALYFTSEHVEGRGRADIYRIDYRR